MRALICAREYGSSEWPNTWTPSMWEDTAAQNLSRQTMTTTVYNYIYDSILYESIYAMQSGLWALQSQRQASIGKSAHVTEKTSESVARLPCLTSSWWVERSVPQQHCAWLLQNTAKWVCRFAFLPSRWNSNFKRNKLRFPTTLSPLD